MTLDDTLAEMDCLMEPGPSRGRENADPPDPVLFENARKLLTAIQRDAAQRGLAWVAPEVSPTQDGGVDLVWRVRGATCMVIMTRVGSVLVHWVPPGDPTRSFLTPGVIATRVVDHFGRHP